MPAVVTNQEAALVVAWQSFTSPAGDARRGQTFRANHPLVVSARQNFVDASLPEAEWPGPLDDYFERQAAADRERETARRERELAAARANPVTFATTLYRATADFVATVDGRPATVKKGSTVVETHPVFAEWGEMFEAVRVR